ncbi:MAG: M56 family metallopeptidase, partial [Blastocatellia bacterium]|nr:M56 family metallopeptidase [Blastocatellia bacterium]
METINNWFLIFLGNALWQPLVIAAAALGCDILLRKASARQRHLLWVAALALCLLMPLLGASGLFHGKAPTTRVNDANVVGTETGVANDKLTSPTLGKNFLPMIHAMTQPPALLMIIVLACYWFSLLFHGIRMWRSWRRTRALLAASARRALPDPLASIKEECEKTIGLQNVALLSSAEIGSPLTAGKRSIVLPESLFDSAASDLLLAAIGHEMARIKRRDFVCNLLYELLSMPLAFHPAVIFSKRRIKETRELACDELVTEKLIGAPAYARSLLQLADSALAFN